MQCPHCGTDAPDSAAFCPGCGHRLADAPVQHTGMPLGQSPAPPANTAQQLQNRSAQIRAAGDVAEQELWRGGYSYKAMTGTLIAAGLLSGCWTGRAGKDFTRLIGFVGSILVS